MAKVIKKRSALRWTWAFILLSLAVILAGATLCEYAAIRVMEVAATDSVDILHEPTDFVTSVKDVVGEMAMLVGVGLMIMMLGFAVFAIAVSRRTTLRVESVQIAALERRVKRLEKELEKH
jgi:hypothetical protein